MEESKLAYDGFLEKVLDFALDNVCQRFYLYPFDKVVDDDNEEFSLTCC